MELSDYVNNVLCQVVEGVERAQENTEGNGTVINPNPGIIDIQHIEFDVIITQADNSGSKAGFGVFNGLIGAGVKSENERNNTSQNRIKFKVPIIYKDGDASARKK